MVDRKLPLGGDDADDLPRTLRRERDAREREAREREAHGQSAIGIVQGEPYATASQPLYPDDPRPADVRRLNVPFFHLMFFLIKAVLAAIPAIILLGLILFGLGKALETYAPEWRVFEIVIKLPPEPRR